MFIPRIYYPHPLHPGENVSLEKETAHYVTTVIRLKNEELVILFNGEGGEYVAKLFIERKRAMASIISFNDVNKESSLEIHLGQGLARGDRMDIVVQKATELGVKSITPLFTKQSNVKLSEERADKRLLHWQKIAISACEQSGRTHIPTIHEPVNVAHWVEQQFTGTSILLDTTCQSPLKDLNAPKAIRLAIGPESGWEEHETAFMLSHDFTPATLGPRILRTETASIATISILQGLFGDLAGVGN